MFKKINKVWQLIGGGLIAPAMLTILLSNWFSNPGLNVYQWLLLLHLPIII